MAEETVELSRMVKVRNLPPDGMVIEADAEERARLAARFGICAIHALSASVALEPKGESSVRATGRLTAEIEQDCSVSGEAFATRIDEPIELLFIPEADSAGESDEEVELASDDLDEVGFTGDSFDLGEAVAQTLGLAIDPYAEGPGADAARAEAGIASDDSPAGPLAAALAALRKN